MLDSEQSTEIAQNLTRLKNRVKGEMDSVSALTASDVTDIDASTFMSGPPMSTIRMPTLNEYQSPPPSAPSQNNETPTTASSPPNQRRSSTPLNIALGALSLLALGAVGGVLLAGYLTNKTDDDSSDSSPGPPVPRWPNVAPSPAPQTQAPTTAPTTVWADDDDAWNQSTSILTSPQGSLAFSGNGLVVALAPPVTRAVDTDVRIYRWNSTDWDLMGSSLIQPGTNNIEGVVQSSLQLANAATSLSLSTTGHQVAVARPTTSAQLARVQVYQWNDDVQQQEWTQLGPDIIVSELLEISGGSSSNVELHSRVQLDGVGQTLAWSIGGCVYVFAYNADSPQWQPWGSPFCHQPDSEYPHLFGLALSLSTNGLHVALSPPAQVWERIPNDWQSLKGGEHRNNNGGVSSITSGGMPDAVALSNDGHVLAVGGAAWKEGERAVQLYKWESSASSVEDKEEKKEEEEKEAEEEKGDVAEPAEFAWTPWGPPLIGSFGTSLSMSGDGTRIAVGADTTTTSGERLVRVYQVNPHSPSEPSFWQFLVDRPGTLVRLSEDGRGLVIASFSSRPEEDPFEFNGLVWGREEDR